MGSTTRYRTGGGGSSEKMRGRRMSIATRRPIRMAQQVLFAVVVLLWLMSPASADEAKSAADYFISHLPGAPEDVPLRTMHAGQIELNHEHNANMFFWHYASRHTADRARTIIWLNGGPGCSSEDGALMEVGPYRVLKSGNLTENAGGWDEHANLMFVDNPVGTGFSYVDTDSFVHELDAMADQFVAFLTKWFSIFPHFETDDLYLAGESYAGQYIPYIAAAISKRNKQASTRWNLQGLAIGNGWISPVDQYLTYRKFANEANLIPVGSDADKKLQNREAACVQALSEGAADHVDSAVCELVLQEILNLTQDQKLAPNTCINMYDVRLRDTFPSCGMSWPPDLPSMTDYLRRDDVKKALHVGPGKRSGWTECNGAVGGAFTAANSTPSIKLLPGLLEEMRIMLFSGDKDLICNHLGTEELVNNLKFNGGKGFETAPGMTAPREPWTVDGEPAGMMQTARNLTYLRFYNASHMVPFDYPIRSLDMIDRFMGVNVTALVGPVSVLAGQHLAGLKNGTIGGHAVDSVLKEATRKAYYRSGQIALAVIVVVVSLWAVWLWRQRRGQTAASSTSYARLAAQESQDSELGLAGRHAGSENVEMTSRFLSPSGTAEMEPRTSQSAYSLGGLSADSDDEDGPGSESSQSKQSVGRTDDRQ